MGVDGNSEYTVFFFPAAGTFGPSDYLLWGGGPAESDLTLLACFDACDTTSSGSLDLHELLLALNVLGLFPSAAQVSEVAGDRRSFTLACFRELKAAPVEVPPMPTRDEIYDWSAPYVTVDWTTLDNIDEEEHAHCTRSRENRPVVFSPLLSSALSRP